MLKILPIFLLFVSCSQKHSSSDPEPPRFSLGEGDNNRLRWLDRVGAILNNGSELSQSELDKLLSLKDKDAIEFLIEQKAFADTLLSFHKYYLGYGADQILLPQGLKGQRTNLTADAFSIAVSAAKAFHENEDYLSALWSYEQPTYMGPLRMGKDGLEGETFEEKRRFYMGEALSNLDRYIQFIQTAEPISYYVACLEYRRVFRFPLLDQTSQMWISERMREHLYRHLATRVNPCGRKGKVSQRHLQEVAKFRQDLSGFFDHLISFEQDKYQVESVIDIRELDFDMPILQGEIQDVLPFAWFWGEFPNSSTNLNRKRAAYVLKRFLCDDLVPIAIVEQAGSGTEVHGSEAECHACHYKLDPVAGYFRLHGFQGRKFLNLPRLRLSDAVQVDRDEYSSHWRQGDKWQVGLVRSETEPELNDMHAGEVGPQLRHLFQLIQRAPEAKKCFVENVFRFFAGDRIGLDQGYLNHLVSEFSSAAKQDSRRALKELVASVMLSASMRQDSPQYGECYDFAPNTDLEGRPPCQIAAIVSEHCQSCHSSSAAAGGLDMEDWDETDGFHHIRPDGSQLSRADSFASILDRLTISHLDKRMPLGKHMSSTERAKLVAWIEENL